jgi:hypothetical protein
MPLRALFCGFAIRQLMKHRQHTGLLKQNDNDAKYRPGDIMSYRLFHNTT